MDQAAEVSSSFVTCLLNLRRANRGLFCLVMSTSFLMIGFLGSTISGSLVVYLSLMTCALAPGLVLHVLPSGFVPMIKSFFPVNPYDDGTDVFAEDVDPKAKVPSSKAPSSKAPSSKVPSSTFPLPMLFDLISNPSSDDSNQAEVTFLQRQIAGTQSEATSSNLTEVSNEVSTVENCDFPEESFIRRAISSAISFGTSPSTSSGNQSPKDGDRSPGSNASGRSSNGIKIVTSHYESSGGGTPSESDDNLLDESYEIVTDNEINQLNR